MGRNQNDVRIRQSARREDDVCPELLDVRIMEKSSARNRKKCNYFFVSWKRSDLYMCHSITTKVS
jgi:hypothetical protein